MMYQYLVDHKVAAVVFLIIVLAVICIIAVKILQSIGMEKVRKTVYLAFVDAENRFKKGDNRAKFEYVVSKAKKAVPAPFNLFITEKLLRNVIQLWFDLCKDLLDDGRINGTGKESASEDQTDESGKEE